MTPRVIDWRSIQAKLHRMSLLLEELAGVGPVDVRRYDSEPLTELAVERIVILLVDLAFSCNSHVVVSVLGRTPNSYTESFALAAEAGMISGELAADLRPSAGMRNVLVHAYLDVDRDRVARAVPLAITQYREYVRQAAAFALKHAD